MGMAMQLAAEAPGATTLAPGETLRGTGYLYYDCAECRAALLERMSFREARGIVVRCPACGTLNRTPDRPPGADR